jgi:hypothetical protein
VKTREGGGESGSTFGLGRGGCHGGDSGVVEAATRWPKCTGVEGAEEAVV